MNFHAFGQYTALVAQARDAAGRRFAHMTNASARLRRLADMPEADAGLAEVRKDLDDAAAAEAEMRAALEQAILAADLCGQRKLQLADLRLNKG